MSRAPLTPEERERRRLARRAAQVAKLPPIAKVALDGARKARLEELRRARLDQHQAAAKASPKRPPHSERVLAKLRAAQEALAEAEALRLRGAKPAAVKQRLSDARRLEREAGDMDREDLEATWRDGAIDETVRLAQRRGESVAHETFDLPMNVLDEHGAKLLHTSGPLKGQPVVRHERITRTVLNDRGGGLEEALDKGWLALPHGGAEPGQLYEIGDKYGAAYEIDEGHKSNSGGGGGGFGPKGPQLRIVEAGEFLAITRAALTARERKVLDLVCGERMRLRRVATFMKAGFPATQRALRGGLEAALIAWECAKRDHLAGEAVARVKRGARILGRAR